MTDLEILHELIAICEKRTGTVLLDAVGHIDPEFEAIFLEWFVAMLEFHRAESPEELLSSLVNEGRIH